MSIAEFYARIAAATLGLRRAMPPDIPEAVARKWLRAQMPPGISSDVASFLSSATVDELWLGVVWAQHVAGYVSWEEAVRSLPMPVLP